MGFIITLLIKLASSSVAKELAMVAIEEVVKSTDTSIDDKFGRVLISEIAKSKGNKLSELDVDLLFVDSDEHCA